MQAGGNSDGFFFSFPLCLACAAGPVVLPLGINEGTRTLSGGKISHRRKMGHGGRSFPLSLFFLCVCLWGLHGERAGSLTETPSLGLSLVCLPLLVWVFSSLPLSPVSAPVLLRILSFSAATHQILLCQSSRGERWVTKHRIRVEGN